MDFVQVIKDLVLSHFHIASHVPYCVFCYNSEKMYYFSKISSMKYDNGPMEYILTSSSRKKMF